jgi:hypothetical protein
MIARVDMRQQDIPLAIMCESEDTLLPPRVCSTSMLGEKDGRRCNLQALQAAQARVPVYMVDALITKCFF